MIIPNIAILITCGATAIAVVWHAVQMKRSLASLEARLARQADALSLLAETSETGFAAFAQELERRGATNKAPRKPSTRRITSAAKKGRSTSDIAAAEQLSEGEVLLRLQLAAAAAAERVAGGM